MYITGKPMPGLANDAKEIINLYQSLGENAENFLPVAIVEN
jgi:hypothetical protein